MADEEIFFQAKSGLEKNGDEISAKKRRNNFTPDKGYLDGIRQAVFMSTGLPESFVDDVEMRLLTLGYSIQDGDGWSIAFGAQKVANEIKNECNVSAVPEGLYNVAVDMVCGEFLLLKKASGLLSGFEVDLNAAGLKQVQEGDTNVTFMAEGVSSSEGRLNAAINYLLNHGKPQFVTFRRLRWT